VPRRDQKLKALPNLNFEFQVGASELELEKKNALTFLTGNSEWL
jgi:hypothetical protein